MTKKISSQLKGLIGAFHLEGNCHAKIVEKLSAIGWTVCTSTVTHKSMPNSPDLSPLDYDVKAIFKNILSAKTARGEKRLEKVVLREWSTPCPSRTDPTF